jgi:hypothetical protein
MQAIEMLDAFLFSARRIVMELGPADALRLRGVCRQAAHMLKSQDIAAAAFALTRAQGVPECQTLNTWLHAWKACTESLEASGHDVGAWAYSNHIHVSAPVLSDGYIGNAPEDLALFGIYNAELSSRCWGKLLSFMETLVGRDKGGLKVISVLAMHHRIFPEEYQDSDYNGCAFQCSSVLLLSNSTFAVMQILYAPEVVHFRNKVQSSCRFLDRLSEMDTGHWMLEAAFS